MTSITTPTSKAVVTDNTIQVIVGPMFAGKTTRLLQLHGEALRHVDMRYERVLVIKYAHDTRYSRHAIVTHDDNARGREGVPAIAVQRLGECEITMEPDKRYFLFVDEAQFFDDLEAVALRWQYAGHSVVLAALDLDSERRPWEHVAALLGHVHKLHVVRLRSTCAYCQRLDSAEYTRRILPSAPPTWPANQLFSGGQGDAAAPRICIGGKETYQPCCGACWPIAAQQQAAQCSQEIATKREAFELHTHSATTLTLPSHQTANVLVTE